MQLESFPLRETSRRSPSAIHTGELPYGTDRMAEANEVADADSKRSAQRHRRMQTFHKLAYGTDSMAPKETNKVVKHDSKHRRTQTLPTFIKFQDDLAMNAVKQYDEIVDITNRSTTSTKSPRRPTTLLRRSLGSSFVKFRKTSRAIPFTGKSSSSVGLLRYNMACQEVMIFMNIATIVLAFLTRHLDETPAMMKTRVVQSLVINVSYSIFFGSFLITYEIFERPSIAVVRGMWLFFIGQLLFVTNSVVSLQQQQQHGRTLSYDSNSILAMKHYFYIIASHLFLVGSILFTYDSLPTALVQKLPLSEGKRDCDASAMIRRLPPFQKSTSYFWGSVFFVIGSIAYATDSIMMMSNFKALIRKDDLSFWTVMVGLCTYLIGRMFCAYGCTTEKCDIFFRNSSNSISNSVAGGIGSEIKSPGFCTIRNPAAAA